VAIGGGSGGGGRGAGDVRAGGGFFEIYAKDGLSGVLDKLKAKMLAFASFMRRVGTGMMAGGAAAGAGPLAFLLGGIGRANDVANLSRSMNIPIDQMQRLKYAADAAGVSVDDVLANPAKFGDLLAEAPMMDPADIARAVDAQKEYRLTVASLQNAMLSLLDVILPVVKMFAEFVRQNADGIAVVALVAAGVFALGVAFTTIGAVVGGIVTLFTLLFSTGGLIVAGIAAVLAFTADWKTLGEIFQTTWKGIVDAVKGGDLELAFDILGAGISAAWFSLLDSLSKALTDFIRENKDKIIAVGAVLGGVGGAVLGARFGPWGALIGGGAGAGAGALGADELANLLAAPGIDFAGKADAARARLEGLAGKAAKGVPPPPKLPPIGASVEMVRGGFGSSNIQGRFGYGDATRPLLQAIVDNTAKAAEMMAKFPTFFQLK
jgi:hypothetical protein